MITLFFPPAFLFERVMATEISDSTSSKPATHVTIPLLGLDPDMLAQLSSDMKLSLSREDMVEIQKRYAELDGTGRHPTDVELEVIAQTWSEHCKHRIFAAEIHHRKEDGQHGSSSVVDGIFNTYVRDVTRKIMAEKPELVLSAFVDNAGFLKLDDNFAVCLKLETHNHPSAIEPYAGANTGLGGVIRDILGAGKGSKPVASLDIFCFGRPETDPATLRGDTLHPLGIMRGVVRGVRDYGNRMGIPTVGGAIHFDDGYTYNPLVFCGTAGIIPIGDIDKKTEPGHRIISAGGRTGRDGLRGATFSSASLHTDSHADDQQAVQIGNPIEEKKASDFVLHARAEGLLDDITDCGAGGYSSACGEMLEDTGGNVYLDNVQLKQPGLVAWEIFLSEAQERMVFSVSEANMPRIREIAAMYDSELTELGESTGDGFLRVHHHGRVVCELHKDFLHDAPRKVLQATSPALPTGDEIVPSDDNLAADLLAILADVNNCSREPIIREYDHEVQGNTLIKPLAGAFGDAPQDACVIGVDGSEACFALGVSILPHYGDKNPYHMGLSCVDETMRQLVAAGADPERIGLLDNYCLGNPEVPEQLGKLVDCARGMAEAALAFGAPFVSGKDSFYNCYADENGDETHIPATFVSSGMGILEQRKLATGASLRRAGSDLWLLGETKAELGASALARHRGLDAIHVPGLDPAKAMTSYRALAKAIRSGLVLAAHDCSEGGLAVALAEMAFSGKGGILADVGALGLPGATALFSESNARLVLEVSPEHASELEAVFAGCPITKIGTSTDGFNLTLRNNGQTLIDTPLGELKEAWKTGLVRYY